MSYLELPEKIRNYMSERYHGFIERLKKEAYLTFSPGLGYVVEGAPNISLRHTSYRDEKSTAHASFAKHGGHLVENAIKLSNGPKRVSSSDQPGRYSQRREGETFTAYACRALGISEDQARKKIKIAKRKLSEN